MMRSRFLALVLAGAMAFSTLPMSAMASDMLNSSDVGAGPVQQEGPQSSSIINYSNGESEGHSHTSDDDPVEVNSTAAKTVTDIDARGSNAAVNVESGSVKGSANSDNSYFLVSALDGAKVAVEEGGVDAKGSSELDAVIFADSAYDTETVYEGTSVTVRDDVEAGDYAQTVNKVAVAAMNGAEVTIGGNVFGAGEALVAGDEGKVNIGGDVSDTYVAAENTDGDIHIGGSVSARAVGALARGGNTNIEGDLNVEGAGQQEFDNFYFNMVDTAAIMAMEDAHVVVGGDVNVNKAYAGGDDTVTAYDSSIRISGDVNTDRDRAIKAGTTEEDSRSIVEVCGNVNSDVLAEDMNSDITIIIGGELVGKLSFVAPEKHDLVAMVEEPDDETYVEELVEDTEDETEVEMEDERQSSAIVSFPAYEDRVPADGAAFVIHKADADNMFDINEEVSLEDYMARTYYIIDRIEMEEGTMVVADDEVTAFTGLTGLEGWSNRYDTVREGESFTVTLNIPRGYKLKSFSAGDGIEFVANGNGVYTVTAARGGGITLEAILQKIAKSLKVEKEHSYVPAIRVTEMAAQLFEGAAKLTAKVTCSNMAYAKQQLGETRFYLNDELTANEYFTVTVNDAGELEIDIAPELLATLEAGQYMLDMVMANGNKVQFSFDMI